MKRVILAFLMLSVNSLVAQNDSIHLRYSLPEIAIKPSKRKLHDLGIGKVSNNLWSYHYNGSLDSSHSADLFNAQLIENPFAAAVKIKAIKIAVARHKNEEAPFELDLLAYDKAQHRPGKSILTKPLKTQNCRGGGWTLVNIDSLNLYLPQNGIVLCLNIPKENFKKYRHFEPYYMAGEPRKKRIGHYTSPSIRLMSKKGPRWAKYNSDGKWRDVTKIHTINGVEKQIAMGIVVEA